MTSGDEKTTVIIVGAGPSGLATAACLNQQAIPYIILEREDCIASLFNKKSYNRLHLHLKKHFCQLPYFPFPKSYPTYVSRIDFLKYLDDYASHFNIRPSFGNFVKNAKYDEEKKVWKVETNVNGDQVCCYEGRFLVVATGEASEVFIPQVDGLSEFKGEVIHSTEYKSGEAYENKKVLVVGAGNSGMEIALDLSNYGAQTSIVVRSPIHILPRWSANHGIILLRIIPLQLVDLLSVLVSKLLYGDITKYGLERPSEGPLIRRVRDGKYPVIDAGTFKKIKSGEIQVLPALNSIKRGNEVVFENGKCYQFDTLLFATGFTRSTHLWLQDGDCYFNKDGLPKPNYPNHWKGENGLYCVGLARRGLYGAAADAENIANHISNLISK
ncbi:probable indole-3-pyruvate monooxygenase YUCCA10 [Tanacetum coccineum]